MSYWFAPLVQLTSSFSELALSGRHITPERFAVLLAPVWNSSKQLNAMRSAARALPALQCQAGKASRSHRRPCKVNP